IAGLWGLPLLVIVEHNRIAQSTPSDRHMAGTVADRATAFGIGCDQITNTDVVAIRRQLTPIVQRIRTQHVPHLVVFHTVRLGPHSKGDDTRPRTERADLAAADWLGYYTTVIPDRVRDADARARASVDAAVAEVRARQPSSWSPT
ncbi:MAG: hypothetical protein J2P17_13735, partial [Mycobacterium sp.]|nr:hypothetical protein [Mycobacterium sp.]